MASQHNQSPSKAIDRVQPQASVLQPFEPTIKLSEILFTCKDKKCANKFRSLDDLVAHMSLYHQDKYTKEQVKHKARIEGDRVSKLLNRLRKQQIRWEKKLLKAQVIKEKKKRGRKKKSESQSSAQRVQPLLKKKIKKDKSIKKKALLKKLSKQGQNIDPQFIRRPGRPAKYKDPAVIAKMLRNKMLLKKQK